MALHRVSGSTKGLVDILEFEKALSETAHSVHGPLGRFFLPEEPIFVVRAPARLDVMGGIADYSGAMVCEMPLDRAVVMGVQARKDRNIVLHSAGVHHDGLVEDVTLSLDALAPERDAIRYDRLRAQLARQPAAAWAGYVAGAFSALCREKIVDRFPHGATMVLTSNIPLGAGVSSSAAVEVAAMNGIRLLYGLEMDGLTLARLAQIVENRVVGAPCGIMDQVTSAIGREGHLLCLLCQPHEIREYLPLPDGLHLIGIHSNVRHRVGGVQYTSVRIGAFMGLAIILSYLRERGGVRMSEDPFQGYLCNIPVSEYENAYRDLLPREIKGQDFLERYGKTPDTVTRVEPERVYLVRSRVEHPIYEHERVEQFIKHLKAGKRVRHARFFEEAGRLMYASDWSYTHRCGLGSPETSWLTREIKALGASSGFYGAKITGGGSGGTVAVAGDDRMFDHLERLLVRYANEHGVTAEILAGSSPGALEFGHVVYRK